jgi:hypothetical protein
MDLLFNLLLIMVILERRMAAVLESQIKLIRVRDRSVYIREGNKNISSCLRVRGFQIVFRS